MLDAKQIIDRLGGPSAVARLCECSPQAVCQWFGTDPATQEEREIPKPRLLYLKAVRPRAFDESIPDDEVLIDPKAEAAPAKQAA